MRVAALAHCAVAEAVNATRAPARVGAALLHARAPPRRQVRWSRRARCTRLFASVAREVFVFLFVPTKMAPPLEGATAAAAAVAEAAAGVAVKGHPLAYPTGHAFHTEFSNIVAALASSMEGAVAEAVEAAAHLIAMTVPPLTLRRRMNAENKKKPVCWKL